MIRRLASLRLRTAVVAAMVVALSAGVAASLVQGPKRPMESDAFYFLSIARSLAAGLGYVLKDGFWPELPTMSRSPGWPWVVSIALRLAPDLMPDMVMRGMGILLHSLGAGLTACVAWAALREARAALVAGLAHALHPTALHLAVNGESEPLFLVLLAGGTLGLVVAGRSGSGIRAIPVQMFGFLLMGVACLVRPNHLAWAPFFWLIAAYGRASTERRTPAGQKPSDPAAGALMATLTGAATSGRLERRTCLDGAPGWRRVVGRAGIVAVGVLLFILPSALWTLRNERVCGKFPVLSTLRGQTLYGGNNPMTASPGLYWGYWIFPDGIPGEISMRELAVERSEQEVDEYYWGRGIRYLKEHPFRVPGLVLGKLVRAYVPVPWRWSLGGGVVSVYRWILFAGAVVGAVRCWRHLDGMFRHVVLAVAGSNVLTVAVFWGCARFALPLEIALLPVVGAAVACGRTEPSGGGVEGGL